MSTQYEGRRDTLDDAFVWKVDANLRVQLNPRLDLRNHSPDGFEWGYGGSGPAQLALALLCDATGDDELSLQLYQHYKDRVISKIKRADKWVITRLEVLEWVARLGDRNVS